MIDNAIVLYTKLWIRAYSSINICNSSDGVAGGDGKMGVAKGAVGDGAWNNTVVVEDGVGVSKQLKCKGEVVTPRLVTAITGRLVIAEGIFAPNSSTFDVAVTHWLKVLLIIFPHLGGVRNPNLEMQTMIISTINFQYTLCDNYCGVSPSDPANMPWL